jgi:hypothetical protein
MLLSESEICKLLRSPGIDSEKSILPDCDLIPGLLKGLQIRAQDTQLPMGICDEKLRLNASKLSKTMTRVRANKRA